MVEVLLIEEHFSIEILLDRIPFLLRYFLNDDPVANSPVGLHIRDKRQLEVYSCKQYPRRIEYSAICDIFHPQHTAPLIFVQYYRLLLAHDNRTHRYLKEHTFHLQ